MKADTAGAPRLGLPLGQVFVAGLSVGGVLVWTTHKTPGMALLAVILAAVVTLLGLLSAWRLHRHAVDEEQALVGDPPPSLDQLENALESIRTVSGAAASRNVVFGIVASAAWLLFVTSDLLATDAAEALLDTAPKAFGTTGLAVLGGLILSAQGERWEVYLRQCFRTVARSAAAAGPDLSAFARQYQVNLARIANLLDAQRQPASELKSAIDRMATEVHGLAVQLATGETMEADTARSDELLEQISQQLQALAAPPSAETIRAIGASLDQLRKTVEGVPTANELGPRLDAIVKELRGLHRDLPQRQDGGGAALTVGITQLVAGVGPLKQALDDSRGELARLRATVRQNNELVPADHAGRAEHAQAMHALAQALEGTDRDLLARHLDALHIELRKSTEAAMKGYGDAAATAYRQVASEAAQLIRAEVKEAYNQAYVEAASHLRETVKGVTTETQGLVSPLRQVEQQIEKLHVHLARLGEGMEQTGMATGASAERCRAATDRLAGAIKRLGGGTDNIDVDVLQKLVGEIERAASALEGAEHRLVSRLAVLEEHERKLRRARSALTSSLGGPGEAVHR